MATGFLSFYNHVFIALKFLSFYNHVFIAVRFLLLYKEVYQNREDMTSGWDGEQCETVNCKIDTVQKPLLNCCYLFGMSSGNLWQRTPYSYSEEVEK